MILNLCNKFQFLLILEAFASLIQTIIIIDVADVFFKHHDQDTIFLDVAISLLKSNICMSFKSITSFILIVFIELALTLLNQISCNNKEKSQLNLMKNLVQRQVIIVDIIISLTQSSSDFTSVDLKNLLKTRYHATLNENIRNACINVERKER